MHLTLLTAGSRGDTTPFAALALGLQAAGHRVRLAGCRGFAPTARLYGLDYFALDAAAHRRSQPAALEQLQAEAWQACQGTQAIVYDPFTLLSGYCLAQQMRVPAVAAALATFGPTAAHPAWAVYSGPRLGAAYNRLTHTLAQQAAWQVARGPVQKFWRQRGGAAAVGLAGPYARQAAEQFPVVYGYSPHVLPRPTDWGEHLHVTGFWCLEAPDDWRPPAALLAFLRAGPPPVYVSLPGMAGAVAVEAARRAGQRVVLEGPDDDAWPAGEARPETVMRVDGAPHGWLFSRMAALVHTGGAAQTAAGLRAGVPAVIVPVERSPAAAAWGRLLEARGLGPAPLAPRTVTPQRLAAALHHVLTDQALRRRLTALSDVIAAEPGVARAVQVIGEAVR